MDQPLKNTSSLSNLSSRIIVEASQTPTILLAQQCQTGEKYLSEAQDVAAPINVQPTPGANETSAQAEDVEAVEDNDEDDEEDAVHVVRPTSLEEVMARIATRKASEGGRKDDEPEEEKDAGEGEEEAQDAAAAIAEADAQEEDGDAQGGAAGAGVEETQGAGEGQCGDGAEEEEEVDEGNVKEEGQEERGEGGDDGDDGEEEEEENAGPSVVRATRPRAPKGYRAKPCFVQMITVSFYR